MEHIEQLRAKYAKAVAAVTKFMKAIVDDDGNPRDMTADELESFETLAAAADAAKKQVEVRERAATIEADATKDAYGDDGRQLPPGQVRNPDDDKSRFASLGEFLQAVAGAGMNKDVGERDKRLKFEKAAGANEAVPSEGGFLVQTDHNTRLLDRMNEMGEVFRRTTSIPITTTANGVDLPCVDETSRVEGSRWGGIRAYWANEGGTVAASQPAFDKIELKLNKLMGLGYATDEMLADAPMLESIFERGFSEELMFKTENAFVNGDGTGKPLGFLNSGAVVSVPKESGQTAATVVSQNVLNMWARMPFRSRRNAIWLIGDGLIEPQLFTMTMPTSNVNIYLPPGHNAATPGNEANGFLLGRPVVPTEYMAATGTVGDICLVDLSQYLRIDKGGVSSAQSMHVRFVYEEMAFRITYRVDGQPGWKQPVTTANAETTKSPFVALATRA